MNIKLGIFLSAAFLLASVESKASVYNLPPANESLVGNNRYTSASAGDNVVNVAKRYDIGYNAIENANPQLDMNRGFTAGAPLTVPMQHLLPNQPREGIVINLPEMRMYYYPAGTGQVFTYPIGIGKIGKTIPIKMTRVSRKAKDPTWTPPQDIREFNLEQGIVLPRIMPAGPDNPLGPYAIYTGIPTYLIHSTIFPESIGKRASFGCIRMYETDIEDFFPSVQGGIPIAIVNAPAKAGWQDDEFYVEAHEPLQEHSESSEASLAGMVHLVSSMTNNTPTLIDWQQIAYISEERDGLPHDVGMKVQQ